MRRTRVIPVLLIRNRGVYKSVKFAKPNYIGDPLNAVKILNDKEVDELVILDIDASRENKEPDFDLLKDICAEAFMPLGYGGGIVNIAQVHQLFRAGIEKVILNSALLQNMDLVPQIAEHYGAQSVVVCIDYKKTFMGGEKPYFLAGSKHRQMDIEQFAKLCETSGAGELILQSMDRDGTFRGLDLDMVKKVSAAVSIPVVACGGLNSLGDAAAAVRAGASAVAGGSFFVYKNRNPASILINYPNQEELTEQLFSRI